MPEAVGAGRPRLMPTSAEAETFAGPTYHLDGELVPVLTVEIAPWHKVYFEHPILRWKNTTVDISIRPMAGARGDPVDEPAA